MQNYHDTEEDNIIESTKFELLDIKYQDAYSHISNQARANLKPLYRNQHKIFKSQYAKMQQLPSKHAGSDAAINNIIS